MKKLVWLLVLINVGLLCYFNLDLILPSGQKVVTPEINPQNIKLLSPKEIEALPKIVATAPDPSTLPPADSCYEWGVFSTDRVTDAQVASSNISLQAQVKEQSSSEAKRFWVYKPPLKSPEAAQAKAMELKALGIQELFVVPDSKWKNAISFGVFEDEKLATSLLKELRAKGVKDAIKALRNQGKGHASLLFSELTEENLTELKKLKSDFPEADLKKISCN